jgi:hypothetical protein
MFDNSFSGTVGVGGYTIVFGPAPTYPSYPSYPSYPGVPPYSGGTPYQAGFGFDGTLIAVVLLAILVIAFA